MKKLTERKLNNILKDYNEIIKSSEYNEDLIQDAVLLALENGRISIRKGLDLVLQKQKRVQEKKGDYQECSLLKLEDFQYSIKFDWLTFNDEIRNILASNLTKREQDVINYRFYQELSLEETGKIFGITAESIRRIEWRTLRKLRFPSKLKGIKIYLYDNDDFTCNNRPYINTESEDKENIIKEDIKDISKEPKSDIDLKTYAKKRKEKIINDNIGCFLNNDNFKISRISGNFETITIQYMGDGDLFIYQHLQRHVLFLAAIDSNKEVEIYDFQISDAEIEVSDKRIQYDLYITKQYKIHISIEYYNFFRNKDKKITVVDWNWNKPFKLNNY